MAENETAQAQAAGANTQQGLAFLHQYLKDLSFENPNAASGLMSQGKQPKIDIDVNVNNRDLGDRRGRPAKMPRGISYRTQIRTLRRFLPAPSRTRHQHLRGRGILQHFRHAFSKYVNM